MNVIGAGIDAVDVDRLRRTLLRTPRFAERVFTPAERAYAARQHDPAERLAARFAAKEAAMKALGVGLGAFALAEVEVGREGSGRPVLRLSGRARDLAKERGVTSWSLSLTHTAHVALAIVLALGPTCSDT